MAETDAELVRAVAHGLTSLGLPGVDRNADIFAGATDQVMRQLPENLARLIVASLRVEPVYLVVIRLTQITRATAKDGWRTDNRFRPACFLGLEPGPEFTTADLLDWAHRIVPREAMARMREDCRQAGVAWPRQYPVIERVMA